MGGRRRYQEYDWSKNQQHTWLVRSGLGGAPFKITELSPGSDLLAVFLEEALAVHREGWKLAELTTRFGWFIAHKHGQLRDYMMVQVTDRDPKLPRTAGLHGPARKTW